MTLAEAPPQWLALADRLRRLPPSKRAEIYRRLDERGPEAIASLRYEWEGFFARPDQVVPRTWRGPLIVFGGPRGDGKTEAALGLFSREILEGRAVLPRLICATEGDVAQLVTKRLRPMLPPHLRPQWYSSEKPAGLVVYPNDVEVRCYMASAPEGTVSTEGDLDLYDDIAKWGARTALAWKHARTSCRHRGPAGARGIVATSKRGTALLKRLLGGDFAEVRRAPFRRANRYNLAPGTYARLERELAGDDFYAEEVEDLDVTRSPFQGIDFEQLRVARADVVRFAVWIDPATSSTTQACEVGVVAAGIDRRGTVYGLADRSRIMTAAEWPDVALDLYEELVGRYGACGHLGIEVNKGGNMGPELLRQAERLRRVRAGKAPVSVYEIRTATASKGKAKRAEPVARLGASGQLKMLAGLGKVETQLLALDDDEDGKLDAADAFVWAALDLADLDDSAEPDARAGYRGLGQPEKTTTAPSMHGLVAPGDRSMM